MGNIPFTDERFPIKVVDGNFIRDEFNAYKDTGKLAANMHRAPVLIVGDAVIGQSKSIERYLAKRTSSASTRPRRPSSTCWRNTSATSRRCDCLD